jgi:hypothetical protein
MAMGRKLKIKEFNGRFSLRVGCPTHLNSANEHNVFP